MSRFFIILTLAFVCCVSCSSDETLSGAGSTGISDPSWTASVRSKTGGDTHLFSFTSDGPWQAGCDASWCSVTPQSGGSGLQLFNVATAPNDSGDRREAVVWVRVSGHSAQASFRIVQYADDGDYIEVNEWMADYMRKNYLWNEPLAGMTLDYSLDYSAFLRSMLTGVAAFKDERGRDLNYDDGHWKNGVRQNFYSYVTKSGSAKSAVSTRAVGESATETGLWRLQAVVLGSSDNPTVGFAVMGVTPGTPAAQAGLERGMFISEVDGQQVTTANYRTLARQLYYGPSVRALPNRVIWDDSGVFQGLEPLPAVALTAQTYLDPAIYASSMATVGDKKTAYLLYMGFDSAQDNALIETFKGFRGAEELILDLRYNGGGAVRSSTVLATLIVGDACKDGIYCRMIYNAQRTAAGESDVYRIGNSNIPEGRNVYTPIASALSEALGLKRIYVLCSESTASASELVINGLRGLGIEVRLIGMRTNGKNVGMEGYVDHLEAGELYTFMPITFYSENNLGFRDYSDGFVPDVEFDDTPLYLGACYPGQFGTLADPLYALAAEWIGTGTKPAPPTRVAAFRSVRFLPGVAERPDGRLKGSVVFRSE
ncbi:MAG: hypothetical protein K2N04_06415 [Alistipes sp.]|nr:hypothetical protein [Alistipes sp.]